MSSIFLIGYRGSGKSVVGAQLAERLGCHFVDLDRSIEAKAGRSIAEVFAEEGEDAFRGLESEAVVEVCERMDSGESLVVATGGGVVVRPQNTEWLKKSGFVVWLAASAETLSRRIREDPSSGVNRPTLSAAGAWSRMA